MDQAQIVYAKPAADGALPDPVFDVVVVGGGLAGLAAPLGLARARRSVLVVDAGHPRNEPAGRVHGYLTRDGMPPLELLSIGCAD
jgi:glycine/D-amino acid oxidase-like deaminating enzyme